MSGIPFIHKCLNKLAVGIGTRPSGSPSHRLAADFIEHSLAEFGLTVDR